MNRKCDMCGQPAVVDTKTIYGYWAYLCEECNKRYGLKHWNTLLAGLSEGGSPISSAETSTSRTYEWIDNGSFYTQPIYKDTVKAITSDTIRLTMQSGKTKLISEGNLPILRAVMYNALNTKDYPIKWEVVQL